MSLPLSPTTGSPYGPGHVLDELKETNPEAYAQLVNQPQDTRTDYKDHKQYKKLPLKAGVPHRSV